MIKSDVTITMASIFEPLSYFNIWQLQENGAGIYSSDDDDIIDDNSKESSVGTNLIICENIITDQNLLSKNAIKD